MNSSGKAIKKKNKIIFLHHVAGYMMIDIANAFAEEYEDCLLMTGELRKRRKPLNERIKRFKLVKYNPKNNFSRLVTWVLGFLQALLYILFRGRDADLFITTNPPLGVFIPYFCKNKYFLLIYDIYPDVLIQYNIVSKDSFIIKFWERTNRRIFAGAERVFTIGDGMKQLISKYVDPSKIEIVTCWTDNAFLKPVPKENNIFIKEQKVDGKFLVIYSGNVGYTHDVEILIDLAEKTDRKDLFFFIIGEGDKKKMLAERINRSGLQNIRLLPWQDISMYPFSLGAADLAIVTLGKEASIISVPSKLYDIMSVGSPLLSIAEKDSEMNKVINKYEMGRCCSSDQVEQMLGFIYQLMDDKEYYLKLRANSLRASNDFTPENAHKFVQ
jgi:glycosyltransferase involved in cell wall biosynthesis